MERLKQVLAQEDTVLFIGSGISMWSGLPSWPTIIEELAQFIESIGVKADLVRAEAQKGDLLQAASYGFDKLSKPQIGEFIRRACRLGIAKPHEIHRKIVSLGPSCFVTTNYDNLIEESLRQWQTDRFFRAPVTNRHLTETAEIVHARAINFIFKPHGDATDSESIILTREQYRQLLPQGERHAALESLKMLFVSRPVVYFGFGLRDPDFLYVRDLLANTYRGGTRDHYAIMADVSDGECDYWRRNYGIHLVNYCKSKCPDGREDHTALLILLDTLLNNAPVSPAPVGFDPSSPEVVLALTRHASGLARTPKQTPEFKIRVHAEGGKIGRGYQPDRFDHCEVETFLIDGPERSLLIGLPGAGKTYSLRRAAARLAERLHDACLSEHFSEECITIPIFTDLKLYRGNLYDLVNKTLPRNLPLEELTRHFKLNIFLDSFNEMPREFWESGSYESDFESFIKRIGRASLVIGSRTNDGLTKMGLPIYCLDQIDDTTVMAELQRLGIDTEGRFNRELRQLLQRPFYFQYLASGTVRLPKDAHPRDFYQLFFQNLNIGFAARFDINVGIEKALSLVAYDALNRGEEAFPLTELTRVLKRSIHPCLDDGNVRDVVNWLVSSSVLIPHNGGRIAFVHQSVTEYLAASELGRLYQDNPSILKEKLTLTRWDQSLFLTLSLLPPELADVFLDDVIKADFALALNAVKYLEVGRDEIILKLLSEIPEQTKTSSRYDWKIQSALEFSLPLTDIHEPLIRMLIGCGGSLGSAAVSRLVSLKGAEVKDEMLRLLSEQCSDYSLCVNGIARALKPFATDEDAKKIVALEESTQNKVTPGSDEDATQGFTRGAAKFLAGLDLSTIRRELFPLDQYGKVPELRGQILCGILREHHSTAALDFAGELLLRHVDEAATAIYFISNFGNPDAELSWASFSDLHVNQLITLLENTTETWALKALTCICAARSDLAALVKRVASGKSGIEKAALLYSVSPTDSNSVFQALSELVGMNDEERQEQPVQILEEIELDWTGKEEMFVQLMRLCDIPLMSALFGGSCPPTVNNLGNLDIGSIEWWLEWMLEMGKNASDSYIYWFLEQLGSLFAHHLDDAKKQEFIIEFNKAASPFRRLLLRFVLPYNTDITTGSFSEDAISFLLSDLSREGSASSFRGHVLGNTATEQFITERLLPLLQDAKEPLLTNLHLVLREAGSRHGKRYLLN